MILYWIVLNSCFISNSSGQTLDTFWTHFAWQKIQLKFWVSCVCSEIPGRKWNDHFSATFSWIPMATTWWWSYPIFTWPAIPAQIDSKIKGPFVFLLTSREYLTNVWLLAYWHLHKKLDTLSFLKSDMSPPYDAFSTNEDIFLINQVLLPFYRLSLWLFGTLTFRWFVYIPAYHFGKILVNLRVSKSC